MRPQYIFDVGDSLYKNRLSIFVDDNNVLKFELIDKFGEKFILSVKPGKGGFLFGERFRLWCEFGSSDHLALLQIKKLTIILWLAFN